MKKKIITGIIYLFFSGPILAYAGTGIILNSAITHLDSVEVYKIVKVHELNDIHQAIRQAESKGLKISIAGARYAQGGQQAYPNGIVLDMTEFNKIISLDRKHKIIRVQSGVIWKQIQNYIRPYDFTIRVMQTANVFTVGGSLSSNIHGKGLNDGAITETVKSFHLMRADGKVINVSRQENPELFSLVIGGYGLFGIIIDVDLLLTENVVYKINSMVIDYQKYPEYFQSNILNNPQISWFEAYFLKSKEGYLKKLRITTYSRVPGDRKNLISSSVAKEKEYVSRESIMDRTFKYKGNDQIVLQEFFIPLNKFVFFIDGLREIFKSFREISQSEQGVGARVNVIRYIKQDKQSFLPYAKVDSFSLEIVINMGQSISARRRNDIQHWVRRIVDLSLSCGGSFYLTKIALYPDREQLLKAYPEFNEFIKKKKEYDPQEIFMNQFYSHYR